jgi:hypothetical protein
MDKLFSTLQQSLNDVNKNTNNDINKSNDKTTLLQRQQQSQQKIAELLDQSTEALMCGPTCQKLKLTDELKQKYLDAETNMQTAPINLEQSKKNYYVYSEGRPYYDNMKEEELKGKADNISKSLATNFNEEISSANTMNTYLNIALINSQYTEDLLNEYLEKNKILKFKLGVGHGDILTNDRKTFYEVDALNSLQLWHRFWWYIYYILVLMLVIAFAFSPSSLSLVVRVLIFILVIMYPYYINIIVSWIYHICLTATNGLPKNVYNNL